MKAKTILAALLLAASSSSMAVETADTIVADNVEKVTIVTRDNSKKIIVRDTIEINNKAWCGIHVNHWKNNKAKRGEVNTEPYFQIGLNTMLDTDMGSFNLWPSFDLALGVKTNWHPFGAKNAWSLGVGIDWRNYRMSPNDGWWLKDAEGIMGLSAFPINASDRKVALHVTSVQVPVLYTHYFGCGEKCYVTLGGIVNFNFWAHANRQYELGEEEYDINTKSIGQRPVTIDAFMQVHAPHLPSVYCKYSPMSFFKKSQAPKMHQFTIGIAF